jgi:hypothetical protein
VVAGAAGAAAGNASTQGLQIATGKRDKFDPVEFALNVGFGAAFGFLPGAGGVSGGVERGASEMLAYIGKSWASRGLASSARAALHYATQELADEAISGSIQQWLTDYLLAGPPTINPSSPNPPPNPIRPENAIWVRMLTAGRSTAIGLVGTVRPELLLRNYALVTATEGGR